jgi:hypothetical protein
MDNKKVIAIKSMKNGILKIYGEGLYIGDKVPDVYPFNEFKIKNPCIKLESGKYVWGFECWWGDKQKLREKYNIKEEIIIDKEENIQPLENDI